MSRWTRVPAALAVVLVSAGCAVGAAAASTPTPEPPLVRSAVPERADRPRPVLAAATVRDEDGEVPHDVRVELNQARVVGDVLQVVFTARSVNPPDDDPTSDGLWQVGGLFSDRVDSGGADAPDTADGVRLLDPVNGTRHLPGRNPDGACLCSSGLADTVVEPGRDVVLTVDLAAPPGDVETVDVVIPGAGVLAGIPVDR